MIPNCLNDQLLHLPEVMQAKLNDTTYHVCRAMLQQRQLAQSNSNHRSASTLRATTVAAVTEQAAQVQRQRQDAAAQVKRSAEEIKRQREELRALWNQRGREMHASVVATRHAASTARNNVREHNLSEAHHASAQRLDMFRQCADAQSALSDGKRLMAERVRREAGRDVVRGALSRLSSERAANAAELRKR